jgi:Immunoglobulin-like domain of bacterial spore germination
MRKFIIFFTLLASLFIFTGCNQDESQAVQDQNQANQDNDPPTQDNNPPITNDEEDTIEQNNGDKNTEKSSDNPPENQDPKKDPKPTDPVPKEPKPKEPAYENKSFKDIKITEANNQKVITGKARVFEGTFQYAFISNNEVIKGDHYQTEGAPAWGEFKLTLDKSLITDRTFLELFYYSSKDGLKTDVLRIPLNKD